MTSVRYLFIEKGSYPTGAPSSDARAIPEGLPAQIACLGRHLLALIDPFLDPGPAAAIDSTVLAAQGGVWHKKHREAGIVPHSSIDTEAGWTKTGWHGWVYGWKLHLVTTVAAVWIPLAARLTPANTGDNIEAPALLEELPAEIRAILGTSSTTIPNCVVCARPRAGCSSPPSGASTPIPTMAWRSVASSISCALTPSRTSTPSSRQSSTVSARSQPEALSRPDASSWALSWCTNWPCSINSRR